MTITGSSMKFKRLINPPLWHVIDKYFIAMHLLIWSYHDNIWRTSNVYWTFSLFSYFSVRKSVSKAKMPHFVYWGQRMCKYSKYHKGIHLIYRDKLLVVHWYVQEAMLDWKNGTLRAIFNNLNTDYHVKHHHAAL